MVPPRVTLMFVGILVCAPVLALYQFGLFPELARWLAARLPALLVLPEGGLKSSLLLQYAYYTGFAFAGAWVGLALRALWQKFAFLLGFTYLTCTLVAVLAWKGILFEPFSGILSAWAACLVAVIVADTQRQPKEKPAQELPASPDKTADKSASETPAEAVS